MVVDDDKDFLEELSEVLQQAGYEPIIVADSLSAAGIAKSAKPDLILLDLRMPSMSGIEVAVNLKLLLETSGIPVIAMTAFAYPADDSFIRSYSSIKKCLKKPLNPLNVIKEIEWTLGEEK